MVSPLVDVVAHSQEGVELGFNILHLGLGGTLRFLCRTLAPLCSSAT
jgi:hypothetical protein